MDPLGHNVAANAQHSLDPFSTATKPAVFNLDPFNTENVAPTNQSSLDPFASKCSSNTSQQLPASTDVFDPFAPPASAVNEPGFGGLDELDRAEALAAQFAQDGDIDLNDVEYEEDESDDVDDDYRSSEESDDLGQSDLEHELAHDQYEAVFTPEDETLGIVIADAENRADGKRVVVKMVVDRSPGMREGVTEGSVLAMVNGTNVEGLAKSDCTTLIRKIHRPLTLVFRKPSAGSRDHMEKGEVLARIATVQAQGGLGFLGNWKRGVATWSDKFYVWDEGETLQLYNSEADYQQYTVQLHERAKGQRDGPITIKRDRCFKFSVQGMDLSRFSVSHIKCKEYKSYGTLFYFALKSSVQPPTLVVAKFASRERATVERLHETMRHHIRINKPAARKFR